jgi:uncharacterized phage-associated protein
MKNKIAKIKFPYNRRRAIQAVLWFLNRHGGRLNKMHLVKLVFLADQNHLFRYARPIVGGQYFAMKLGPVPSELLDDIDRSATDGTLPFTLKAYDVVTGASANEDFLSESDIETLEAVNAKYGDMDKYRLSRLTHRLRAYVANQPEASGGRNQLPYEDFFLDSEDKTILEVIRDDQEAWASLE